MNRMEILDQYAVDHNSVNGLIQVRHVATDRVILHTPIGTDTPRLSDLVKVAFADHMTQGGH